ncbi:hypothetical protein M493_05130 [Geobacillus genomosp. 3]|uniref:Uncharacterized protein n=1 Tax=Geobacillus genomosp. 3 TaxID=1921421 RepID=S5ZB39_GEOG3|nr:hypothetical protein M493_05130 [Geobacillus genomosp. 3]
MKTGVPAWCGDACFAIDPLCRHGLERLTDYMMGESGCLADCNRRRRYIVVRNASLVFVVVFFLLGK